MNSSTRFSARPAQVVRERSSTNGKPFSWPQNLTLPLVISNPTIRNQSARLPPSLPMSPMRPDNFAMWK
ncbi:hypothetical protein LINPERHAP2_LOCUS13137, partial [Linum perenne]